MNCAVVTLLTHDVAVAFKNKTVYLILCVPLFVYGTLTLVDPARARVSRLRIALIHTERYAPVVLEGIHRSPDPFAIRWVVNEGEALRLLKARELDGVLTPDDDDATRLLLTVTRLGSVDTMSVMQTFSTLQAAAEGRGPSWIAAVRPLQASSIKAQTLPTWILMMVLLVSLLVIPAQIAEEKEKQLLLGWMQTPVRESEWLASKLAYGIVLILTSVCVLQLMGGASACTHGMSLLAMLCTGGFCFGALGICLGLLCRNQASARTLGVLCYLPLLLPAALSDMSQELRGIAPLIPSYHIYEPLRGMLLEDVGPGQFTSSWLSLMAIGLLACFASHRLLKRRWLM